MEKLVLEKLNKIVVPLFGAAFVLCLLSFHVFLSSADIFQNLLFLKNSFRDTIRLSNSLDSDQARHYVGPDLGPNCLQKLSADDTSLATTE